MEPSARESFVGSSAFRRLCPCSTRAGDRLKAELQTTFAGHFSKHATLRCGRLGMTGRDYGGNNSSGSPASRSAQSSPRVSSRRRDSREATTQLNCRFAGVTKPRKDSRATFFCEARGSFRSSSPTSERCRTRRRFRGCWIRGSSAIGRGSGRPSRGRSRRRTRCGFHTTGCWMDRNSQGSGSLPGWRCRCGGNSTRSRNGKRKRPGGRGRRGLIEVVEPASGGSGFRRRKADAWW